MSLFYLLVNDMNIDGIIKPRLRNRKLDTLTSHSEPAASKNFGNFDFGPKKSEGEHLLQKVFLHQCLHL